MLVNMPEFPDLAIHAGRQLCEELLEPLQDTFGRIHIRSAYRSPEVNDFGNRNKLNCASNAANYGHHIWDYRDKNGHIGATACIVVPWLVDRIERGGSWQEMAWWIHDHLPYSSLYFFSRLAAFNIRWCESPERWIKSYAEPKGTLTAPGMSNHAGSHTALYPGFPRFVKPGHVVQALGSPNEQASPAPNMPPKVAKQGKNQGNPVTVAVASVIAPSVLQKASNDNLHITAAMRGSGKIKYRAIQANYLWRKVNTHHSLENAIDGPKGAKALLSGKLEPQCSQYGEARFVLVWQEGASEGCVLTRRNGAFRLATLPVDELEVFDRTGGASEQVLGKLFA